MKGEGRGCDLPCVLETPLALLMAGPFVLFPLAVAVWSTYFGPKRDGERWASAARALGFTLEPRTARYRVGLYGSGPTILQRMHVEHAGIPVSVGMRMEAIGRGQSRKIIYYAYVELEFPRSLELGLDLSPIARATTFSERRGSSPASEPSRTPAPLWPAPERPLSAERLAALVTSKPPRGSS